MSKPICACCNSDEHVVERSGGGYRCERCKTIWDSAHRLIGPQNYEEAKGVVFTGFSTYSYCSSLKIS
jgi:tRNA(Ile2) C34 agmatinyltransferase TiaS